MLTIKLDNTVQLRYVYRCMLSLSYTSSDQLQGSLATIDSYRRDILLTPLPQQTELRLRWEALVNRIYWSIALHGNPLPKPEIVRVITRKGTFRPTPSELEVLKLRQTLLFISQHWTGSQTAVGPKTVQIIHDMSADGKFVGPERDLIQFLKYLQVNPEHPVIQAAIAQIELVALNLFTGGNGRTGRLLAHLFLTKAGYDCRGLLVLEEYWRRDLVALEQATKQVLGGGTLTAWLEFFSLAVATQLTKAAAVISTGPQTGAVRAAVTSLNDRQKKILAILEEPDTTLTNRKVQKLCKISQITASRDLTKLAAAGLLFSHGHGRSVYYTRV